MSSQVRRIQRRILRSRPDYKPNPQPTVITKTGYWTLRPTKGRMFMSVRRLAAQRRMAEILRR